MAAEVEVEALRRARAALFERVTWWEVHRYEALIPMAVAAFGVGYGLGYLGHVAFGVPYQAAYFTGLAVLLVSGRVVDRRYSVDRLRELDEQIARAERVARRALSSKAAR
ncbi:MAG: hypothetical protein JNK72_19325 [Myxococcales bacterium]|nr:hypothetical protein [Myxococcales bacterium]